MRGTVPQCFVSPDFFLIKVEVINGLTTRTKLEVNRCECVSKNTVPRVPLQVKFMKSVPGTALVEMGDEYAVDRAITHLNSIKVFSKRLNVWYGWPSFIN